MNSLSVMSPAAKGAGTGISRNLPAPRTLPNQPDWSTMRYRWNRDETLYV
jgi:hypothetical protein